MASTALALVSLPAAAQIAQTWNGNTSTDWFVGTNWDSTTAPAAGDSVTLDTITPNPTVINGASGGYAAVDLDGLNVGFTGTGALTVNNGADVTITNNLAVIGGDMGSAATSANGTVILDGAGTTFTVTGVPVSQGMIVVGGSATGAFTVQNGAAATSVDSYVGHLAGASGTVTVDNGTWTNSRDIFVGNFGTGVFNLSNGGTVNIGRDTVIAANTSGNGTINISGATSVWTTTRYTILGGSVGTPGIGGTATLNVSNGGTYTANDQLIVGLVGSGAVNITSGGQLNTTNDLTHFGYTAGSNGIVVIDGAGSAWNDTSSGLVVGGNDGSIAGGNGTITVRNGGALNTGDVVLGNDSTNTSRGTVTVTGLGSSWTANNVFVGWNSIGTVNILDRATFTVNTDLSIGTCNCSFGTMNVGGGSTVTIGNGWTIGEAAGGSGVMTVTGSGTSVTATGDLQVASAGIGTLTIEDGAAATAANVYVGFANGSSGTVTVSGGASLTATGDLTVGDSGTGVLNVRSGATVTAVNGIIGNNAGSSGAVSVQGAGSTATFTGALIVGLGGIGTGSLTIADGGVVNVTGNTLNGDSVTVGAGSVLNTGNYSATAGVTTSFGLRGSAAGQIDASGGVATLNGTLVITGRNIGRTTYTLVNSGGLGGTTFSSVTYDPLLRNPVLTYTLTDVLLALDTFLLSAAVPSNGTTNQRNVAQAFDSAIAGGATLPTAFENVFFLSGDALLNALSRLSGESGAATQQSLLTGAGMFMGSVFDNAFNAPPGAAGPGSAPLGYASQRRISAAAQEAYAAVTPRDREISSLPSFERRWSVWAVGYGGSTRVSGDGGAGSHDMTSRVYGVTGGASYRLSANTIVGFALGGAGSNFSVAEGFGSGKADSFNAAFYGRHTIGPAYVAAALGYSWQDATTDRTVSAGGTTEMLHASFRPQALTTRLEGGWRFDTAMFGTTPYAGVQTTTLFMPSYGETATTGTGAFALSYGARRFTATRGELGIRFDKATMLGDRPVLLKGKLAWAHDWNNDSAVTATFQQLSGATFTVNGAAPAADSALLSFGADVAIGRGWSAGAAFDGEFSRTTASYAGKGSLRYSW
jgi:T5SS/PEP-CTERM-associated repeat protein